MTTDAWAGAVLAALLLGALACGGEPRGLGVFARKGGVDRSLERACTLTERRCSRCHPIDRVLAAEVSDPGDWEAYVRRMRRTPGSGILAEEEPVIVRCLVHHSFGPQVSR
jgi:hypothetical protein